MTSLFTWPVVSRLPTQVLQSYNKLIDIFRQGRTLKNHGFSIRMLRIFQKTYKTSIRLGFDFRQ